MYSYNSKFKGKPDVLEQKIQEINELLEQCMEKIYHSLFANLPKNCKDDWLLDELVQFVSGGNPETRRSDFWAVRGKGIPWVELEDLIRLKDSKKRFLMGTWHSTTQEAVEKNRFKLTVVPENSILISCQSAYKQNVAIMAMSGTECCFSPSIFAIVPNENSKKYIYFYWYWLSNNLPQIIEGTATYKQIMNLDESGQVKRSVSFVHVLVDKIKKHSVAMPPHELLFAFGRFCESLFQARKYLENELRELIKNSFR